MGSGEIVLVVIAAALSYFIVASMTARLFNGANPRSAFTGVLGLLWPASLPVGLLIFMVAGLVLLVEWGAGLRDFGEE